MKATTAIGALRLISFELRKLEQIIERDERMVGKGPEASREIDEIEGRMRGILDRYTEPSDLAVARGIPY